MNMHDIDTSTSETSRCLGPYLAYKDSGVDWMGKIPSAWGTNRLKRVVSFCGGGTPSKANPDFWKGDIPWVSPKDMKRETIVDTEDHVTEEAIAQSATRIVQPGAVLIVVRSGILTHSIPVATNVRAVALNQDMKALIPSSQLLPDYLKYFIAGQQRALLMEWRKEGATVESVEHELLANTTIPIASTEEQRLIAAFLDREAAKIDALVAKKERLIELLQEKRAALITHAVTKGLDPTVPMKDAGVEWLGKIPVHWEVKSVRNITKSLKSGPFGSQLHSEDYVSDGIPVINPSHLKDGRICPDMDCAVDETAWHRLRDHEMFEGDIIFARRGEMGRCALVTVTESGLLCGTGSLRMRPNLDMVHPPFLNRVLSTTGVGDWLSLESVGATMENLNTQILGRIRVPVPSVLEQNDIAVFLDHETAKLDALITKVREGIEKLKEYRTALISAAVTGKIDVREAA